MNDTDTKEIETIKALVEFTWKQENIEAINDELRGYIERISDEVMASVEERFIDEVTKAVEKRITEKRRTSWPYLTVALSFAGVASGIAIATLAGIIG